MDTAQHQAAEAMYRVMVSYTPCTCLRAGFWPFRSKAIVEGKPVDKPDVICARCKAMAAWGALELARLA